MMVVPINKFAVIQRVGEQTIGDEDFFESRFENDANGNPIYAAWSPIANANPADRVWFIKKFFYDSNQAIVRVQQPDDGPTFTYAFDNRASYFS